MNNFITSRAAGGKTKPLYQTRGLRQGCNLSSILFFLYNMDLGGKLLQTKLGIEMPSEESVGYLMFAEEHLNKLKGILEEWCVINRMKVSFKKHR